MSAQVLTDAVLWIGQYSFQGITNSLALALEVDTPECTVFGDTYRKRSSGLKSVGVQMEGYWDAPNDLGQFGTLLGASYPVTVAPESEVGSVAYIFNGIEADYQIGAAVGETFKFSAGAVGAGACGRGVLFYNGVVTAGTTFSQIFRLGSLASNQTMYIAVHVSAVSGASPTLGADVVSDDNAILSSDTLRYGPSPFTAPGSYLFALDGPITDDYWRFVFGVGGTGSSFTVAASMAIVTKNIFAPDQLASLAAWFRFNQGITLNGSNVSQWDDASGNARHLKQTTATNQPARNADGSILFDGVDNYLQADAFAIAQPYTSYMLVKQVGWTTQDYILHFGSSAGVASRITQLDGGASPQIEIGAPTAVGSDGNLAVGAYGVIASVFNGAGSFLGVNLNAGATLNPGTNAIAGLTLAAYGVPGAYGNIEVKEVLVYSAAHDAATREQVIRYLARIGGIAV